MIIADDFGLDPAHDEVIIRLLEKRAIDGTSVMVSNKLESSMVSKLKAVRDAGNAQVGLHINLTENLGDIASFGSILSLWIGLRLGFKNVEAIAKSIEDQLQRFHDVFGFAPDYIDGHQHCHAISKIWPILFPIARTFQAGDPDFWVRSPAAAGLANAISECRRGGVKTMLVMWWGENLRRRLVSKGLNTNSDFSGFIPYKSTTSYEKTFRNILANRRKDSLIMVHPGSTISKQKISGHADELRAIEARVLEEVSGAN